MKVNKCLILILILIIIVAFGVLIVMNFDSWKSVDLTFESRIKNIEEYNVGENEILGWVQVQGTNIDYPVTHSKYIEEATNEENLNHTWESGFFVDGENRRAIFGHNILNVGKPLIANPNHTRFEQLMSFVDYKFAKKNQYIQYTMNGKDEIYKIFAVGFYYTYEEGGLSFNKQKMKYYISDTKKNSIYNYDVDASPDDEIISLITCTRYFGLDGPTQFRVDARKVRKNEKIEKYRVEKSKNYDIIK